MDKYTVDLDQVLNDFEYSELTDQHSKNVSNRPQSNVPFQPSPVTKHSINNVFHSLNEYLNSGISDGSVATGLKQSINDNKLDHTLEQDLDEKAELQDNISKKHFNSSEGNTNVNLEKKSNELHNSLVEKEIQEINSHSRDYSKEKETPIPEQDNRDTFEKNNVDSIKTEFPSVPVTEAETESFIETDVNNYLECDRIVDDKADTILSKEESSFEGETNNREEREVTNAEIIQDNNATDILVDFGGNTIENIDTESKLEGLMIEMSESSCIVEEVSITTNQNQNSKQSNVDETLTENLEASNTENMDLIQECAMTEDCEVVSRIPVDTAEDTSPPKIIGFSTDIDIDENELNKMLEDLELEGEDLDDHMENRLQNIEDISVENNVVESDLDDHVVNKEEISVENNVADSTKKEASDEIKDVNSDVQKDIKSYFHSDTTQNALSGGELIEKNTHSPEEILHAQVIECLEMKKPTKNRKRAAEPEHSDESIITLEPTKEILEKQSESTEQELYNEALSPEKKQSQEPVSRPQNLPLNNELKDENAGRKINLIGSPGSTPYNNVYINKSIEPKTTQDTESDYTSSASPTFSDCSTESTSTASTVSVENVPNNADKFTKKTSKVKNTNAEIESDKAQGPDAAERDPNLQQNVTNQELANPNITVISEIETTNATENASNPEIGAGDSQVPGSESTETFLDKAWLGKEAPLWIPDGDAAACLHCKMKFTVLKRRHHCRACGLVLCSKCCNLKFKLEYLDAEARVCNKCYNILIKDTPNNAESNHNSPDSGSSPAFRPNPNNPLEYCSTVSPLQQAGQGGAPPPSVMVPVGVLKRKGSNKKSNKSVMFCDGIAPGSDLTNLDQDFNYNSDSKVAKPLQKNLEEVKKDESAPPPAPPPVVAPTAKVSRNQPKIDQDTGCFIPKSETSLPPTITINKTDILYSDCSNSPSVVEMLKNEALVFAIHQNLFVHVKVINMSCCINKQAWCFCSEGLINVGSDEIVYLIEYIEEESFVPKDVFFHIHNVYLDTIKGTSIKELGLSLHNTSNFLDSRNHAGFVYLKPSFQCLENVIVPKEPYLIGILIHRWETPWAKLFPLRLILRLGAEYRYYPSPLISTRHRDSVFVEIGHTIINLLADFRNFTYTLPQIRGLIIHMEDKKTTITIPKNRYDQVMKSINNSSEHILAFAGNFSPDADSHLVCIQDTQGHENCYTTHAINIHNKPRKITGASFIVFNGSLKSSSGLTAKSNIVEDGLMIQIPSEHMEKIRDNLRNMKDHTIACGCLNATSDETVNIVWGENDVDFNVGIQSPVDDLDMKGIPSIRVHNGKDYFCNKATRLIRWTEVFILQSGEENPKNQDPVDISKVSESVAKASCTALVKYLDLLVSNSCQKIGIRTNLHVENVSYSAGSNGQKLPPIYMRSLDNELVPVLHRITSNNLGDNAIVLELIFRILNA